MLWYVHSVLLHILGCYLLTDVSVHVAKRRQKLSTFAASIAESGGLNYTIGET